MPPRKTPKQIEGYLAYYDEQKASGNNSFVADTAKKAKVATRTVHNWVNRRNEISKNPEKKDTTDTYTEIVDEKEIDKEWNEDHFNVLEKGDGRIERMQKNLEEQYPRVAKSLFREKYQKALDETYRELRDVTTKDTGDMDSGTYITDVISNKRKPLTVDDEINDYKQDIELTTLKTRDIWAKYHLNDTKNTFEEKKEGSITQTKNENRLLDDEIMDFIKSFLQLKSTLPTLDRNNQTALINQFIREKALIIFPLIDNILYDSNKIHQESKSPDDEFDDLWASIPEGQRKGIYNLINGE